MSHFFAYLARMKYIARWGLMRNTRPENIQEHSLQVAMIAHGLAVLRRRRFGGGPDPQRVALLAVFHDAEEVITGDLPTPIKYFNPQVAQAVDGLEAVAKDRLLRMLPSDLQGDYQELFFAEPNDDDAWACVKAADRICAYLKCVEEREAGNGEFAKAEQAIRRRLAEDDDPAVQAFLSEFAPSFGLTLDELN
ncbi:MAG: 5'-deoxynucleotidase [Trueperaceae bacterium]